MNIFIYYCLAVNYFQKHRTTTKNMITITKISDDNNSTNILRNTTLSTNDVLKSLLHIDPTFQF